MTSPRWRLTLVIPCFNEAARLRPEAFLQFLTETPDAQLLFVDDGSSDGTWKVLERLRGLAPDRIRIERIEKNCGKGETVRFGLLRALTDPRPPDPGRDLVGYWDADLSTPLDQVSLFLRELEERADCEVILGSRVRLLGRRIERNPVRHYVGRIFATIASLAVALPVYDTQCGAKIFRATPELQQVLSDPFLDPWVFDVEILARFGRLWGKDLERRVVELPLQTWRDVEGSRVRPWHGVRALVSLLRIWIRRVRG